MSIQRRRKQFAEWRRLAASRSRRDVLKATGAVGLAGLAGCAGSRDSPETTAASGEKESMADSLTVFHAGSLAAPFEDAEAAFEKKHGVEVNREAKGSVGSTKKITEQGRWADVLGVADFRLIRDMMMPKFANWYAIFSTNAMTIAYTEDSTGADEFSAENWWEILAREDVKFAHSDPAIDPNGYRSVMAMQLGRIPFDGERLYDDATYKKLREKELVPAGTETELIGQLTSGKIDYAWEYQSAGASHDIETIDLQPEVDLSKATTEYAAHYAKAKVETESGTFTGAPIAYGLTVPNVAKAPDLGAKWVEFMITGPGRKILEENGLVPVSPAVVPAKTEDSVPELVMKRASAKEKLGPMEL